jgi:magnesium-transporting ATPase (P-type)
MRLSPDQSRLCVMTSDGCANIVNANSLQLSLNSKKCHNMPLTACAFLTDRGSLVSASTDFTYLFSRMSDFSAKKTLMSILMQASVLIVILIMLADYLYWLIKSKQNTKTVLPLVCHQALFRINVFNQIQILSLYFECCVRWQHPIEVDQVSDQFVFM